MLISQNHLDKSHINAWEQCLEKIEDTIGPHSFETWFRTTNLSLTQDGNPCIEVPNQFFADFIEEHFTDIIKAALSEQGINTKKLSFSPTKKKWNILKPIAETVTKTLIKKPFKRLINSYIFHPDYTFDTFVVGDSNRFAHATCLAVAEAPGKTSFNPLTVYGGTGLGKTHLLQAIGHFAQNENTAEKIIYITQII